MHRLASSSARFSRPRGGRSSSARSRSSQSPSRTSSRHGSGSPSGSHCRLHLLSHLLFHRADEDRQEEQLLLEFVNVIVQMKSESRLPEAPLEGCKIHGFCEGLDDDEQPESSYRLPIGDASADILADIDDHISSTTTGMRSKKVSKLLSYPSIHSRQFYWFEGEEVVKSRSLNHHAT